MATDNIALVSMHSDSQGDSHSHEGPPPTSNSTNPARPSEIRPYLRLLFPWFWTVAFVVWLVIVIRVYEAKGVLTKWQKDTFNFITTGLILFLGLSFYVRVKLTYLLFDSHFNRKPSRGLPTLFPSSSTAASTLHSSSKASTACLKCFNLPSISIPAGDYELFAQYGSVFFSPALPCHVSTHDMRRDY